MLHEQREQLITDMPCVVLCPNRGAGVSWHVRAAAHAHCGSTHTCLLLSLLESILNQQNLIRSLKIMAEAARSNALRRLLAELCAKVEATVAAASTQQHLQSARVACTAIAMDCARMYSVAIVFDSSWTRTLRCHRSAQRHARGSY